MIHVVYRDNNNIHAAEKYDCWKECSDFCQYRYRLNVFHNAAVFNLVHLYSAAVVVV